MHLPVPKAGLIGLSALFALVAALAVFVYSSGEDSAEAATYDPATTNQNCNQLSATFPDSKPITVAALAGNPACSEGVVPASTSVDSTTTLTVLAGDSNYASSVVTNSPGTTVGDAAIPDGDIVGGLRSDITLALLNGPCATALVAEFVLYDSSTTGSLAEAAEGTTNRWSSIVTDVGGDEIADSTSAFVGTQPSFYNRLFTTDGGTLVVPKARYTGATVVPAAGDWQMLSFFQFDAGGLDAFANDANDAPDILGRVSHAPADGTLSLSILNDTGALEISVSPIHDFCTPLIVQTMLLGTSSGGSTRYTTAPAGTYAVSQVSYGQRDADGDGLENDRDTCAFVANSGNDGDFDGIDDACDPTPAVNTGLGDHDFDGYANRQDNCPQTANGGTNGTAVGDPPQLDSEAGETYLSAAPDGGPQTDSIGDVCDPSVLTADGQGTVVEAYNIVVKCIGGADGDGDGYCTAQDIDDADAGVGGYTLNKGMDWEYSAANSHGDSWGGNNEIYIGTDSSAACGAGAWPADLVASNSINISDVLALKPVFGTAITTEAEARKDLVPSLSINISDVLALKPVFGASCTP